MYRCGDSLLHRLDARIKLLWLILLIGCLFSAESVLRLVILAGLWLGAALAVKERPAELLRVVRGMRWLLLGTLVLHLLMTPGRTLLGTTWLSQTGLLRGLFIDAQLLLAVLFSLMLARTTRPADLAGGMTSLLSPLRRLRVPVRESGALIHLALTFLPLIHQEIRDSKARSEAPTGGVLSRLRTWARQFDDLLTRLIDQADQKALELASHPEAGSAGEPSASPIPDRRTGLTVLLALMALGLIWQV